MAKILEFLRELVPKIGDECPSWPPDVYGISAALLQRSGAYRRVVEKWAPIVEDAENPSAGRPNAAAAWRKAAKSDSVPVGVQADWAILWAARAQELESLTDLQAPRDALLRLLSLADQASVNAGIPLDDRTAADWFDRTASKLLLEDPASLGRDIDSQRLRILPKLHTPQHGLTIRSLSHNLAFYRPGDLDVRWYNIPHKRELHSLNLLLVPWPDRVDPIQFKPAESARVRLPTGFGFFEFTPRHPPGAASRIGRLISSAQKLVGRVDGVILPELALPAPTHRKVRDAVLGEEAFLISGVQHPSTADRSFRQNAVHVDLPAADTFFRVSMKQHKHHRWSLDRNQIVQYGLGSTLDPRRRWWEGMPVNPREVYFVAMRPWLTMCAMVCEDLARQEPLAEVVRAVGPNLVVVLLMDGPQLPERWSARYATVLADDPGSSVLTLTSRGMTALSCPPGKQRSTVVGLWKDAVSGPAIPLDLPAGADALVISLAVDYREEWTADGRSDQCASGYPIFAGLHDITDTDRQFDQIGSKRR